MSKAKCPRDVRYLALRSTSKWRSWCLLGSLFLLAVRLVIEWGSTITHLCTMFAGGHVVVHVEGSTSEQTLVSLCDEGLTFAYLSLAKPRTHFHWLSASRRFLWSGWPLRRKCCESSEVSPNHELGCKRMHHSSRGAGMRETPTCAA